MRLDKYIAIARLLKSRALVKTAADEGMVFLNGIVAKPAAEVRINDIIEIDIPRFYKKVKVIAMPPKNLKKSEAAGLYESLEERKKELI
jgi:ribosomal 50S subunit-recycling heat shock protein